MKETLEKLWNFFFPAECLNCGAENSALCPRCVDMIPISLQQSRTPLLKNLWVLTDYHHSLVQKSIETFKFFHGRGVARDLRPFLERISREIAFSREALLVPVPLHFFRKNMRGYNQSLLLAQEFSVVFGNPVEEILRRTRWTSPQVHLSKAEREKNLIDAFAVRKSVAGFSKNTPIVLIDDVATTLSTLHECARALRKAGFRNIMAVALARTQS